MKRKEYIKKLLDRGIINYMWSDYIGRTIQSCVTFTSEIFNEKYFEYYIPTADYGEKEHDLFATIIDSAILHGDIEPCLTANEEPTLITDNKNAYIRNRFPEESELYDFLLKEYTLKTCIGEGVKAYLHLVKEGQKRMFISSGKVFTVWRKKYDDRDIWECLLEDGTIESHNGNVIETKSYIFKESYPKDAE